MSKMSPEEARRIVGSRNYEQIKNVYEKRILERFGSYENMGDNSFYAPYEKSKNEYLGMVKSGKIAEPKIVIYKQALKDCSRCYKNFLLEKLDNKVNEIKRSGLNEKQKIESIEKLWQETKESAIKNSTVNPNHPEERKMSREGSDYLLNKFNVLEDAAKSISPSFRGLSLPENIVMKPPKIQLINNNKQNRYNGVQKYNLNQQNMNSYNNKTSVNNVINRNKNVQNNYERQKIINNKKLENIRQQHNKNIQYLNNQVKKAQQVNSRYNQYMQKVNNIFQSFGAQGNSRGRRL